jgi:hypothetical protein
MPKKMTHNEFDILRDLLEPMKQFFIESNIVTSFVRGRVTKIKDKYYFPPKIIREAGTEEEKKTLFFHKELMKAREKAKAASFKPQFKCVKS